MHPDGQATQLTRWRQGRWFKFPFFDGDRQFVYDGRAYHMLHDGSFGYGVGGTRVSPDTRQAVVMVGFEGGLSHGLLIDLRTGQSRKWEDGKDPLSVKDWTWRGWHTRFESLSRQELISKLSSGTPDDQRNVLDEWRTRSSEQGDWDVVMRDFADVSLPSRLRESIGYMLWEHFERRNRHASIRNESLAEPALDRIGSVLDDSSDRGLQLRAADLLCLMAKDPPTKEVEFHFPSAGSERFNACYERYVPVYQVWWRERNRVPSTTQPVQP